MIALLQRVSRASVTVDSDIISEIKAGYLILLGIYEGDTEKDMQALVNKIINLRVMKDDKGDMNTSILDTKGEILVVSQFTLCADITTGRRPSFSHAKAPEEAERLYLLFAQELSKNIEVVKTGKFRHRMNVALVNDGPVTIILDSQLLLNSSKNS